MRCLFALAATDEAISTAEEGEIHRIATELRIDHGISSRCGSRTNGIFRVFPRVTPPLTTLGESQRFLLHRLDSLRILRRTMALAAGSNSCLGTVTGPLGKGGMGEVWRARDRGSVERSR